MELSTLGLLLPLVRLARRLRMTSSHTTMPPHLLLLALHELLRPLGSNGLLVAEHEQRRVAGEIPVQVLERPACGLGVEEVDCGALG
jgi:hypothetical protein